MSNQEDFRAEALEHAELTEDSATIAMVYAITNLADQVTDLIDQVCTLAQLHAPLPEPEMAQEAPRLTRLLSQPDPFEPEGDPEPEPEEPAQAGPIVMPSGRQYRPAHDPRLWRPDPNTGDWISPAGRRFSPTSNQVKRVLQKLENMRKKGTLYTTPIRRLEDENS